MKIVFADIRPDIVNALKHRFSYASYLENPQVSFEYYVGDIFDVPSVEAYVTAGNSYAVMTGGIDLAFRNKFGIAVQDSLQHEIFFNRMQDGLPIGESVTINLQTGQKLIYSPTMRIPCNVKQSQNAFIAFSSALLEMKKLQRQRTVHLTVACPGLCTLTGGMKTEEAARQMFNAYRESIWCEHI